MKLGRIVALAAVILGLVLLPLTVVLVCLFQARGLLSLSLPGLDPGSLLASLGGHDLAARLLDASGRAGQTPCPGCVAGGTGAGGAGNTPSRPIDSFTRGWLRWWEQKLEPIRDVAEWGEEVYRDGEELINDAIDAVEETWNDLFGPEPAGDAGTAPAS